MNFEPLPDARFRVESDAGVERIVIPAGRNWFVMLFLPVWLLGWSAGGISAFAQIMAGEDVGFLLVWLTFWAVGMIFAISWLGWQLSGKEILFVERGALVRAWRMPGFGREKRYDVAKVKNLSACSAPFPYSMMRVSSPPFFPMTFGSVKWNYGASTIFAGAGLSEAEGEMIVDRLKARLPAGAR
jgi:hypothetical protein